MMKQVAIAIFGIFNLHSIALADNLSPADVVKVAIRSTLENDLTAFHHSVDVLEVSKSSKEFDTPVKIISFLKSFQLASLSLSQLNNPTKWKDGTVVYVAARDPASTVFHLSCEDAGFALLWRITQITQPPEGASIQHTQIDTRKSREAAD